MSRLDCLGNFIQPIQTEEERSRRISPEKSKRPSGNRLEKNLFTAPDMEYSFLVLNTRPLGAHSVETSAVNLSQLQSAQKSTSNHTQVPR